MAVPYKYMIKNFKTRKLTTFITIGGIALVVFVFAAVLMMAYGVEKTLVSTGSPDNVKIQRKSSQGEISSLIDGDTQNIIKSLDHIKKNSNGAPIYSAEPVVVINLNIKNGGVSNVTVRGVSNEVKDLRPQLKITEGQMFNPSLRELIVGKSITNRYDGAKVGDKIKFAGDFWSVVGIFEADGSGFESEVWGDASQLLNAFNRGNTVSTITLKLDDMKNFDVFRSSFLTDKRLQQYEVMSEKRFFEMQSEILAMFIRILGTFITVIFSFGAIIGAAITMYAAVSNRTIEIGTMRSLGFSRKSILTVFVTEALLIALIGAGIGLFLASFLQFLKISTLNWNSFADLTFSFALNQSIIISSFVFAAVMGLVGGFFPAVRASRLNIVKALKGG